MDLTTQTISPSDITKVSDSTASVTVPSMVDANALAAAIADLQNKLGGFQSDLTVTQAGIDSTTALLATAQANMATLNAAGIYAEGQAPE